MSSDDATEKNRMDDHPGIPPPDQAKRNEGWAEMMSAIRTIKVLQRQAPPLRPLAEREKAPLSFAQQRLWFLCQLEPNSPVYNTARAYRIVGPLNLAALTQSLSEVVRRHDLLHSTFSFAEGQLTQVATPDSVLEHVQGQFLTLRVVDRQDLPSSEQEGETRQWLTKEAQQSVDLVNGPLLRVTLLCLGHREYVLVLVTHQMLFDGQAWGVLNREISALYEAFSAGRPSPLSKLSIQYADYAAWQRKWLQGETLETLHTYWRRQLDGSILPLSLPILPFQTTSPTFPSKQQSLALPGMLAQALRALSRQEGVTLFTVILAALQTFLHRYTRQDDILVFSPASGRNRAEIRKLIGLFTHLLPLRTDLSGDPSFRELLLRVRDVTLGAFAHQDLPLDRLLEHLQVEENAGHSSPFQVILVFESPPAPPPELVGLSISPLEADTGMTKFDLSLFMADTTQGLSGTLVYRTDLFEPATIARMLECFQTLLKGIVADPDRRLSELPCWTEAEQEELAVRHHDTPANHLRSRDLFSPTPEQAYSQLDRNFVAPRNILERRLATIWARLLGVQSVGIRDNFFDLGGYSLLLAKLSTEIKQEFGQRFPLGTFFRAPTVEQLAMILDPAHSPVPMPSGARTQPIGSGRIKDTFLIGLRNRVLQALALYVPGATTTRVWLHRKRGVTIGSNTFIGVGVIVESGFPKLVSIGSNVAIGVRSVIIAHFGGTAKTARMGDGPSVRIEDNVYIGPGVIVLPNVTIAHGSVVAAGSVVNRSIPPQTMVQGNPAEPVAHCGTPLMGNSYDQFIRNLDLL